MEQDELSDETSSPARTSVDRPRRKILKPKTDVERRSSTVTRGWTQKENEILLKGLQKFGLTRLNSVAEMLPKKNVSNIKYWLWKHSRLWSKLPGKIVNEGLSEGMKLVNDEKAKSIGPSVRPQAAITKSILLLENLEEHPTPASKEDIDIKMLYTALYMAMKGYPLPTMNVATKKFFYDSLQNVLKAASSIPTGSFPVEDNASIKRLCENEALNPLQKPVESMTVRIDQKFIAKEQALNKINSWLSPLDWSSI